MNEMKRIANFKGFYVLNHIKLGFLHMLHNISQCVRLDSCGWLFCFLSIFSANLNLYWTRHLSGSVIGIFDGKIINYRSFNCTCIVQDFNDYFSMRKKQKNRLNYEFKSCGYNIFVRNGNHKPVRAKLISLKQFDNCQHCQLAIIIQLHIK